MKKLVLDVSTWRCGLKSKKPNTICGSGSTLLLNDEGYKCCLGQFATQINPDITDEEIRGISQPSELSFSIEGLNIMFDGGEEPSYDDTDLSNLAIGINDDEDLTIDEKIEQLQNLFCAYGFEIEVINKP